MKNLASKNETSAIPPDDAQPKCAGFKVIRYRYFTFSVYELYNRLGVPCGNCTHSDFAEHTERMLRG
ncbi:hypothetical protein [Ruminococcus sp.]|uniref:hypothetical protein n=1 Tax=Ruminococcus sp. TaxID=41978 RepID=UPI003AB16989